MEHSPGPAGPSTSSLAELDALLDDPSRWPEIDPDKLRHLLFYRCLSYGLQPDESAVASLMGLHRVAVERLHPAVRRQVVVHLARAVERVQREHELREGMACTNALLPFLLEDPDPSVVSAAALEMALLLPPEGGDPLTGPRYLRGLSGRVAGDDPRAGLLAGLLQLGDARVGPLLERGWTELGVEGRQTLALLVQSFHGLTALTIEFLLAWLEDEVREPGSATFGIVAATLARAGRHAAEHGVDEFERTFPVSDAPDSAPATVRHQTLEECRSSIAARLIRAGRAEAPPRLMPHVLNYWGLDEEAYQLAVAAGVSDFVARRSGAGRDDAHAPVELDLAPDWPEAAEKETLLEWAVFNPLGPTVNTLRLTPTPAGAALVYTLYHPTGTVSRVMAVVRDARDAAAVGESVVRAMAANGEDGVWLVRSLPDYVHVPAESPLERRHIAAGFAAARNVVERDEEERIDLDWHAGRLRRLAEDPWGTADREIEEATARRASGAAGGTAAPGVGAPATPPPDAAHYLRWLDVASDADHVQRVRSQIPVAWQRSAATTDEGVMPDPQREM